MKPEEFEALTNRISNKLFPNNHRQSRVINRDYVRRWALDYAKANRSHKFTRVSEYFLNYIERECKNIIMDKIRRTPSKGKTLQ